MDLSQLESFLEVAATGSFTVAARRLGLTQPAVSRQVQKLEGELRAILLTRGRGAVHLTPAGERFRAFAQQVLTQHREMLAEVRATADDLQGELRIAASTTPGEFLVPGLLATFRELCPAVQPRVFISDSAEVVRELLERRWDIGFVGARIAGAGLSYAPVAVDEIVLAVPAGHPFAGRAEVEVSELEGQPFLEREGGSGTLLSVRRALEARGLSLLAPRVAMVLGTTQAIVSAVQSGYGMGFVSSLALADRAPGKIAVLRLAGVDLRRQLYLVREKQRTLSAPAQRFAEFALQSAAPGLP